MSEIKVVTNFNADIIEQYIDSDIYEKYGAAFLAREIINLRERGVREALIELGWTPPKEES
jgi:hypothetical protein